MNLAKEYKSLYDNFEFSMQSVKEILDQSIKETKDKKFQTELEKEIVKAIKEFFPNESPEEVIQRNIDSFEQLITEIGLMEKYGEEVVFIGHNEYKSNKDLAKQYEQKGKQVCISSIVYVDLLTDTRQEEKFSVGVNMSYVYMHTVIDQFILDSIRITMISAPDTLRSGIKISHQEIIECGNYDKIIEKIIDDKMETLGRGSYIDKINYLASIGIKFKIDKKLWHDDMILFCEIRNSLIHNKAKLNMSNYIKLKGTVYENTDFIGTQIILTEYDMEYQYNHINTIAKELFRAVNDKFINNIK